MDLINIVKTLHISKLILHIFNIYKRQKLYMTSKANISIISTGFLDCFQLRLRKLLVK